MAELKKGFEELGFVRVATYLNSGNVVFSSTIDDKNVISHKIKIMIE